MGLTKEQKHYYHHHKNKSVISKWEEQLEEWERDELILEIIDCWKEQGLNGYKQIKK